jgi:hypothetical protein
MPSFNTTIELPVEVEYSFDEGATSLERVLLGEDQDSGKLRIDVQCLLSPSDMDVIQDAMDADAQSRSND